MTFEEALKRKNKIGKTTNIEGITYSVIIAPLREKDYDMFLETYSGEELTDEYASSFSANQQYRVSALKVIGGDDIKEKTLYPTK